MRPSKANPRQQSAAAYLPLYESRLRRRWHDSSRRGLPTFERTLQSENASRISSNDFSVNLFTSKCYLGCGRAIVTADPNSQLHVTQRDRFLRRNVETRRQNPTPRTV
jgi:hypothetical protein